MESDEVVWRSLGGLLAASRLQSGARCLSPAGAELELNPSPKPELVPGPSQQPFVPLLPSSWAPIEARQTPPPALPENPDATSSPPHGWSKGDHITAEKSVRVVSKKSSLLLYGNKRLAPGFKKFSVKANTDLIRVTFRCGLDRHGEPCEHRIGLFYAAGDDVRTDEEGEVLYRGKRLEWGNTIPAVDKKTQGKLAQTWRTHFLAKHGWGKHDPRLPRECRLKSARCLQSESDNEPN